jgi:cell wall assembly regulator SMI1
MDAPVRDDGPMPRPDVPSVAESWGRIVTWLRDNAPVTHSQLDTGASEDSLAELEAAVGPVPEPLKEWLRLSDGCHWQTRGFIPYMYRTLSCSEIADSWRMHEATRASIAEDEDPVLAEAQRWLDDIAAFEGDDSDQEPDEEYAAAMAAPAGTPAWDWLPQFLPVLHTVSIDSIVIDRRDGASHGCLSPFDPESPEISPEWPSVEAMLRDVADSMERGRTADGWRAVVEDGQLTWEPTH